MRRVPTAILAAAILAAVLLIPAVPASAVDGGEDDGGDVTVDPDPARITVYGYVSNISDEEGNVPLAGVEVTLANSSGSTVATDTTDSSGMFELTYAEGEGVYLYFEYPGYTVRTLPNAIMTTGSDGVYTFSLDGMTPDEDGRYRLSGDGASATAVGMAITNGTVEGVVLSGDSSEPYRISGATITLVSATGERYTVTTDEDGRFSINVPYGTYTLTASCNGFQDSESQEAHTYDESPTVIVLRENEFGIDFLGGLDMPHALMALGLVLIAAVILISLYLFRRSHQGDTNIIVVNDLEMLEEEDEKVERP